jgi:acyl-CoA synthetase (AMP-forming)/AMP-acid ligase II
MLWQIEDVAGGNGGLYDATERRFVSYSELLGNVSALQSVLASNRKLLVALFCDNSLACIAAYLAALRAGHAVLLVNAATDLSLKKRLCDIYSPEVVIGAGKRPDLPEGRAVAVAMAKLAVTFSQKPPAGEIYPDTALLLSTSGTTGSPKLIRLSHRNLQANAEAIVQYLGITSSETAITSLPLSYSYGLSVVNSHLLAGANLVCTNASLMTQDFWKDFSERRCSSFAGVPFSYSMLERLHFERMDLPSLRTMTQAGGRLAPEKVQFFADIAKRKGFRFFVMYGQTEATARISYVPWERLADKIGSIGLPVPGGNLRLMQEGREITDPFREGELIYSGPNVMLGYAETRECLAKGDQSPGTLHTGDLGYRDAEGYFYITGRLKRFIKIYGLRLNLDEIEKMLESALRRSVACSGSDDNLHVLVESNSEADAAEALQRVVSLYKLHHSSVCVRLVAALPVNASGKKEYVRIGHERE